jgi:AAA+ superfamily predicted ATPase
LLQVFEQAYKKDKPCLLVIDQLDAIAADQKKLDGGMMMLWNCVSLLTLFVAVVEKRIETELEDLLSSSFPHQGRNLVFVIGKL